MRFSVKRKKKNVHIHVKDLKEEKRMAFSPSILVIFVHFDRRGKKEIIKKNQRKETN